MRHRRDQDQTHLSVDQVIEEAMRREQSIQEYYQSALASVGPDARTILTTLYLQENDRFETLRALLSEIRELRELNAPMVG
jgi:rubrerythrin